MAPALTEPLSPSEKLSSTLSLNVPLAEVAAIICKKRHTATTSKTTTSKGRSSVELKGNDLNSANSKRNDQMGLSAALNNHNNNNNNNNKNKNNNNNNNANKQLDEDTSATSNSAPFQDNSTERCLLANLTSNFEEAISAEICLRNQLLVDCDFDKVGVTQTPQTATNTNANQIISSSSPKTFRICEDSCRVYTTTANPSKRTHASSSHMESETKAITNVLENVNVEAPEPVAEEALGPQETVQAEAVQNNNAVEENPPLSPEFYEKLQVEDDDEDDIVVEQTKSQKLDNGDEDVVVVVHEKTKAPLKETAEAEDIFYGSCVDKKSYDTHTAQIIAVEELPPISTDSTMTASEVEDNLEERLSQLDGIPSLVANRDTNAVMIGEHDLCSTPATPPQTPQHQQESAVLVTTPTSQQRIAELKEQLLRIPVPPQTQPQPNQQQQLQTAFASPLQQQQQQTAQPARSSSALKDALPPDAGTLEDHDIEEMLKVLKGLDGHTVSDTLGDLNLLFSEDCNTLNYEDIGSVGGITNNNNNNSSSNNQASTSAALNVNTASSPSSHPSIVSAIAMPALQSPASNPLKEVLVDVGQKQQSLLRKLDFLDRRLRKLQARYMCRHASEEIGGLFEYSLRTHTKRAKPDEDPDNPYGASVISSRPRDNQWASVNAEPVFKSEMCGMLQKIETVGASQTVCTTPSTSELTSLIGVTTLPPRKPRKNQAATSSPAQLDAVASRDSSAGGGGTKDECVVPAYDPFVSAEMSYVSEVLHTQMHMVQDAIDSDATESSSGADSADEMLTFTNQNQQTQPIAKRAAWRYACDRAATASRWSWLLSQIADLEIKIRQYQELFQEVVRTKGPVLCDAELEASAKGLSNVAATSTASAASLISGDPINGLLDPYQSNADSAIKETESDDDPNALTGCCRTRGFVPSVFRKRKLLQTINIHQISKKAARPSTIKCGCETPQLPCAVCTGRSDPTAPRDLPDTMMKADRVALLDPGYHPVLSFPQDVDSSIYLEAIACSSEWQQRVLRCQVKSMARSVWKAERAEATAATHTGNTTYLAKKYGVAMGSHVKRRYIKKKDRLAGLATGTRHSTTAADGSHVSSADGTQTVNESRGNGIGTLSTSATPLGVANKMRGDGNQMEILSPMAVLNHNLNRQLQQQRKRRRNNNNSSSSSRLHRKMSDYRQQNCDQYKPNQAHSSLISQHQHHNNNNTSSSSSKNKQHRNKSLSAATGGYHHHHTPNNHHNQQHNNNHHRNSQNPYNNIHQQYNGNNNNNSETTNVLGDNQWDGTSVRSRNSSPTHWGINSYYKYERSSDRKNRTSYDIDNIVIPYSVAATTRVEILPYKEIPTPKWRVIDKENESKCDDILTEEEAAELTEQNIILTNGLDTELTNEKPLAGEGDFKEPLNDPKAVIKAAINRKEVPTSTEESKKETATTGLGETKENISLNTVETTTTTTIAASESDEDLKDEPALQRITRSSPCSKTDATATSDDGNDVVEPLLKKPKMMATKEQPEPATTKPAYTNRVVILSEENRLYGNEDEDAAMGGDGSADDEAIDEDITDDAISMRHERALTEERRKFQTFLKFPWSTRSRANRRLDSRAESSGANTPDPASPAPQTPSISGGDQESIPSPLAPSTPLDNATEVGETPAISVLPAVMNSKRLERRRTTSTKKDRELERRSATPDLRELIPPYEPLQFPLADDEFNNLMRSMPTDYQHDEFLKSIKDCYHNNNNNSSKTASSRSRRSSGFVAINAPPCATAITNPTATTAKRNSSKSSSSANCDVLLGGKRKLHNNITSTSIKDESAVSATTAAAVAPTPTPTSTILENQTTELPTTSSTAAAVAAAARVNGNLLNDAATTTTALPTDVITPYLKAINDCFAPVAPVDSQDEETAEDDDEPDDDADEDDYANNFLLPNEDEDYTMDADYGDDDDDDAEDYTANDSNRFDHKFDTFMSHQKHKQRRRHGQLSDEESSEPEPFQDDDPNDPEWKGSLKNKNRKG